MARDTSDLWDYIIVGSGFGGSVSALRLAEKGYRVLMLEKGRRFRAEDFPKSNWDVRHWMWMPWVGFRGLFKMTFFRHVTVLSGVGVGGGSLVYGNTLPIPEDNFFKSPSWAKLANWRTELEPHYATVLKMLGATANLRLAPPDEVMRQVASDVGLADKYAATNVAVFFGKPGVTVQDPYFGGAGPARTGCTGCGGCMIGCSVGAKNSLDKNYLFLAERKGLVLQADTEVTWVQPSEEGYQVTARAGGSLFGRRTQHFRARNVVFAGGVLGTVPLLLKLREAADGLPKLSQHVGRAVRTNSESLIGVVSPDTKQDLSRGIAIGSILHTDEHSSIEPVRYPAGSGFFRLLALPHVRGTKLSERLLRLLVVLARHPLKFLKACLVSDWAKQTMILLYMRSTEGTLDMVQGRGPLTGFLPGPQTRIGTGAPPTASIAEASDLADRVSARLPGSMPMSLLPETLFNIPTTAHVLGGCTMGTSAADGVIDAQHRVFGYPGLYVIDGAAMSANPGVNPSLTIAALAERAMTFIPPK